MKEKTVPVDWLRVGVFVNLKGLKWHEHPFLFPKFKITEPSQIETIKSIGLSEVVYIPEKSDCLPEEPQKKSKPPQVDQPKPADEERLWIKKKATEEKYKARAERIARVEKDYVSSSELVGKILNGLAKGSPAATAIIEKVGDKLTSLFTGEQENAMFLVNRSGSEETGQVHALNVSVLSMALARKAGMDETGIRYAGLAGLLHDIGKSKIDRRLFLKTGRLTKAERDFISLHPRFSHEILSGVKGCAPEVLAAAIQHHERTDGSGYPDGLKDSDISPAGRIVAIANAYDNFCNPVNPAEALTPFEALATMFANYRSKFDETYLAMFIHCLGIYPPGTIVELSNGCMGLVVSANPRNQLTPSILLIHEGDVPRSRAAILDLGEEPGVTIARSVRRTAVPKDVLEYLSPAENICYYVDVTQDKS